MTADAFAGSRAVLEGLYADLLALLRELDDACVRWAPPVPQTNSIAAMVRHTLGATASWVTRATGEELQGRNRDAEFRAADGAADLVAAVERGLQELQARFDTLQTVDPATPRRFRVSSGPDERQASAAWCVEHAVAHAGEHWGQIQLTRQWYEAAAR